MKILLNLLPEKKKQDIRMRLRSRFYLWQVFSVFALEILYFSLLLGTYLTLNFQLQNLERIGQQQDATYAGQKMLDLYQQKFKETNVLVEEIGKIERRHFSFTEIFLLLDTVLPESVMIERLTTKDYTVMLVGRAATRDDLLALDARLKASACAENVNVPISNLFSQKDVDFQIDFDMKKECLQKPTT